MLATWLPEVGAVLIRTPVHSLYDSPPSIISNRPYCFVEERNQINGIETFWNQAKRHLRRFNGVPKQSFYLFLKECE